MVAFTSIALPFVLAFSTPSVSERAKKLCARVLELQPAADPRWACSFAETLDVAAARHGMDPWISIAIAMQESSLRPGVVGPTGDMGVFQFHPATAKRVGINLKKLDAGAYSVEQHLLLLKSKLRMCPGKRGWSCYHSVTPHLRAKYEQSVLRYYRRPT